MAGEDDSEEANSTNAVKPSAGSQRAQHQVVRRRIPPIQVQSKLTARAPSHHRLFYGEANPARPFLLQ